MKCRTCPAPVKPRRAGCRHGLCPNCYLRWRNAGFPDDGPPAPARPWERVYAARFEDYTDLRSWGVSMADAAVRVGVSPRTAERYEMRRRSTAARDERRAA